MTQCAYGIEWPRCACHFAAYRSANTVSCNTRRFSAFLSYAARVMLRRQRLRLDQSQGHAPMEDAKRGVHVKIDHPSLCGRKPTVIASRNRPWAQRRG